MKWCKMNFAKKGLAVFLSAAMIVSNLEIFAATEVLAETKETGVIQIDTADELAKIGTTGDYPMSGDYVLGADIDLSGMDWTPLGGYIGTKGTMDDAEANVFSGTFNGNGHVISGLTIDLDGSVAQTDKYAQVGLFSVIAGSSAEDYAKVENLIFTDVHIQTDFSDGLASVGTLAGDVNGYSQIDQIVVLSGELTVNPSGLCDTVGAGGLIGECRTGNTTVGNSNISITNCYNAAAINANGTRTDLIYAGGIIGRIAKSACQKVSQCINVAPIQYDGYNAYGIAAAENSTAEYMSTVANCYYINDYELQVIGTGAQAIDEDALLSGEMPDASFSSEIWTARKNCYAVPSICYASSAADFMYLSGLTLAFADGEDADAFLTTVSLPSEVEGIELSWSSSNETVLSVTDGQAVAHPDKIGVDTVVKLTVATASGASRVYRITVVSSIQEKAVFDAAYAKVGTPLNVTVENAAEEETFTYVWTVGGSAIANTANSYTPTEDDLEKFITVHVESTTSGLNWDLTTYLSELPVVYVDTADGSSVDSNTVYEDAHIKVQGNDEFQDSKYYYDGATEIRGRGNSTWSASAGLKRPYKLKLGKKADLLGLGGGKNKHWVLLANMIDHTNMRNELVSGFAKDIGLESMSTTNVVLILNGEYIGTYELCEHVRLDSSRVDVFDWEGYAGDVAEAICAVHTDVNVDDLTAAMETDFSWIDGSFIFEENTYTVTDYIEIPEFTGGFMLDMDFRSAGVSYSTKYVSPFQSSNGIPLFVDRPEYARTSNTMMNYIKGYMNAYEAALGSDNYTTIYNGESVHYTDLFDMDSLVAYWLLCEYTNNWDSMKNSTFLYKDLTGKAKMGPAWDYDWAFGNINMYSMTGPFVYDNWHTTLTGISTSQGGFCEQSYQAKQWNRFLVTDPYFVTKAFELYKKVRPTVIEDMIKEGGKIDVLEEKYQTAADANDAKWSYSYGNYSGFAFINGEKQRTQSQTYNAAIESMKTFMTKRVDWFDTQFTSVEDLYESLGNTVSDKISITQKVGAEGEDTVATAAITDSSIAKVEFIINGASLGIVPVSSGKAEVAIADSFLETDEGVRNTLQVLALDSAGNYMADTTNFINFTKTVAAQIEGTVTVSGTAKAGEVLTATVADYAGAGNLSYQWYADGKAISGAVNTYILLTEAEIGKKITVAVTSDAEEGSLVSKATDAVTKADEPEVGEVRSGILIHHIYGGGAAGSTPISHDFIELYNNSNEDVVLDNYKIGYLSNRSGKAGSTGGVVVEKALSGTIKAKQSYLIRCAENEVNTGIVSDLLPYTIDKYDLEWDRVIDNKQYQVLLYNAEGTVVDAVSVGEGEDVNADIAMVRLGGVVSKQKSLRRAQMGNFYAVVWYNSDYSIAMITSQTQLDTIRPHAAADGYWAGEPEKIPGDGDETDDPGNTPGGGDETDDPGNTSGGGNETDDLGNTPGGSDGTDDPDNTSDAGTKPDNAAAKASSMQISAAEKTMQVKDKIQLTVTVLPQNASQAVTWSSNSPSIAEVSAEGMVTAKKAGKAVITATANDGSGVSISCTITVKKPSVNITGKSSVKRKKSITLNVKTLGVTGKLKVSLDKKGKTLLKISKVTKQKVTLKAKNKKGTAKVTIQCGKYKATKKIKVK